MKGHRAPGPGGIAVKISQTTHARVVLACETLKMTVPEFMDRAALASLERQEKALKIRRYKLACSAAEAAREATPLPQDYDLPAGFNLVPARD